MENGGGGGFVDKSRVLDVKPLRCLVPVFPSSSNNNSYVCSPPFGPYPPAFTPFYPFTIPPSSAGGPTPLRSFRPANGGDDDNTPPAPQARHHVLAQRNSSSSRKNCKAVDGVFGSAGEFLMGVNSSEREDGNKETVDYVLTAFDALRRRVSQIDDAREPMSGIIKRADLKAGNILMSKMLRTNMSKRIGNVPGVEVGDIFFFRFELCLVGLHSQPMAGIDTMVFRNYSEEDRLAISIVSAGGYGDEQDDSDILIYTGAGGNMNKKDKLVKVSDQKLERGNLALDRSSRRANEVRVIRGIKDFINPTSKVYIYDGLYTIKESWTETGKLGCNVFKYKLMRQPGQPPAFAILKTIQRWKDGFASRAGLILPDLTSGVENLPVSLINDVDNEKGPGYFTYMPSLKNEKPISLTKPSFGCNCRKTCQPGDLNCCCIQKNGGDFPYTANGLLVSRKPLIYECGPTCPCFLNCKNRVSQTGLKVHLEVFKTNDRGWGLRSWDPIRAGTFICVYAGELIEKDDNNDEYIFDTRNVFDDSLKWNHEPALLDEERAGEEDYHMPSQLRISSKNAGNVARFMNHSCYPNVFWQPVMYEVDNVGFLHIAFYAIKHIPPMKELTYDYGVSQSGNRKRKCKCGSPNCKGYFG